MQSKKRWVDEGRTGGRLGRGRQGGTGSRLGRGETMLSLECKGETRLKDGLGEDPEE